MLLGEPPVSSYLDQLVTHSKQKINTKQYKHKLTQSLNSSLHKFREVMFRLKIIWIIKSELLDQKEPNKNRHKTPELKCSSIQKPFSSTSLSSAEDAAGRDRSFT